MESTLNRHVEMTKLTDKLHNRLEEVKHDVFWHTNKIDQLFGRLEEQRKFARDECRKTQEFATENFGAL